MAPEPRWLLRRITPEAGLRMEFLRPPAVRPAMEDIVARPTNWMACVALALALAPPAYAEARDLPGNLSILAPLVGKTWTGRMTSPDGRQSWATERRFEVLWDGSAVRFVSSTPEIGASAEGFFYWDREAEKVAVLVVNSRGIHQSGTVTAKDGAITIEGRIVFPERAFGYRNTFTPAEDGKLVDRWFQNAFGDWRPGHVIELTAKEE